MGHTNPLLVALVAVLCLPACSRDIEDVYLDDPGGLCALGMDGEGTYVAGEPVDFEIMLSSCMPCGASETVVKTCEVTQDGEVLTVHATAEYTVDHSIEECTLVCLSEFVSCSSEPLPAGIYTVNYGDNTGVLEVPADGDRFVLGEGCWN